MKKWLKNKMFHFKIIHESLSEEDFKDLKYDFREEFYLINGSIVNPLWDYLDNEIHGDKRTINYCSEYETLMFYNEFSTKKEPNILNFNGILADYNNFHIVEAYTVGYDAEGKFVIESTEIFSLLREKIFEKIVEFLNEKFGFLNSDEKTAQELYLDINLKLVYSLNDLSSDLKIGIQEYIYEVLRYLMPNKVIYVQKNPDNGLVEYYDYDRYTKFLFAIDIDDFSNLKFYPTKNDLYDFSEI